ncbi:hypothetical protein GGI24_002580 [Coemansia furcata]|nr:hypothetical protein GGI24_002580 [Coemansia furcata]
MDNTAGQANDKLVRKLSVDTPPDNLIKMYLTEIASFYHVKWRPDDEDDDDTPGSGLRSLSPLLLLLPNQSRQHCRLLWTKAAATSWGRTRTRRFPQCP